MDQKTKDEVCKLIDERFSLLQEKLDKIDELERSVSFMSNKYDDLGKKFEALELQNKYIIDDHTRFRCNINNITNELEQIKQDLDDMEQYIRRECLEIRGIPLAKDEDTNQIVRKVGQLIDVDINDEDISVSHRTRLSSRNSENKKQEPAIIVGFVRRDVRDDLYKARTSLRNKSTKDLGMARHNPQKIFIAESLTRRNHLLLNQCLQKKKKLNYKFLWTKYGKVLLRKDGSSPAIAITSAKDLAKLSK